MKKIIAPLFVLFSFMSFSQNNAIVVLPQYGNGFVVLNKNLYPSVEFWNVEISARSINGTDVKYDPIFNIELWETNYLKVQNVYWQNTSTYNFIKVWGYDASKNIVVETNYNSISDGAPYEKKCTKICNSPWYAFAIDFFVHPNNGSFILTLNSAYNSSAGIGIPYYRYVSLNDWNNFCNSPTPINAWLGCTVNGLDQVYLSNVTIQDNIKDVDGNFLTGTVVAIRKTAGEWEGIPIQTSPLVGGSGNCGNDLEWAINTLNAYNVINIGSFTELECVGNAEEHVQELAEESEAVETQDNCIQETSDFSVNDV